MIGGYRGFPLRHTASILRWTMKTDPRILFQNIRKHVPDSNPDRIHPHHCQHLNSCTKKYSETRNYGWKYSAGKTELWEEQYFRVLNTTFFFSASCVHFVPYYAPKIKCTYLKYIPNSYRHYQYKYICYSQGHI